MKNDEMFTVLMSLYYKENPLYFLESIESVCNQTLTPNEIVIVCDGPLTDELENALHSISKTYKIVKIFRLVENQGLGKALNFGLQHCSYDLVARMDTDDIARSDRFEKQIKYLIEHEDVHIVGSSIAEFDKDVNNIISYRNVPKTSREIEIFAHKRNPFNHMTVVFRKADVIEAGGYQDMPLAEDYYLWARMLKSGCKGANINENLVYARSGIEMIKRRSSFSYAKKIIILRWNLYKLGFINFLECILYSLGHCVIAILPVRIKKGVYFKLIHKENND